MKKIYTIGRDPQNDIVINDPTNVVSRSHATIKIDGSKISIIDQSQNGTYVNGMRMSSNQEFPVTRKDSISFANVAELDWSLIPDPRKAYVKVFSMAVLGTVVLAGIISAVVYYAKNNITDNEGKDKGTIVKCDSIDLKNTQKPEETKNISEEKAQEEKSQEEKTQEEKTQEEKTQEEKTQEDDSTKKDSTSVDKDKAKPKVSEKKKPGNAAKSDTTKVDNKDKSETDIPLY